MPLVALACLIAGNSAATCLNIENTAVPESTPASNFAIEPAGTLTEAATGLMWKRCLEGQTLVDGVCEGTPTNYTWADALNAAQTISFAGYDDWRLPNPKELLSIFEDRCARPALNADLFPISDEVGIWTATPTAILRPDFYDELWIFTSEGSLARISKFDAIPVLLVRDLP